MHLLIKARKLQGKLERVLFKWIDNQDQGQHRILEFNVHTDIIYRAIPRVNLIIESEEILKGFNLLL